MASTRVKCTFISASTRRERGVASEAWWLSLSPDAPAGLAQVVAAVDAIASARVQMHGCGAWLPVVRVSSYDAQFNRVNVLPVMNHNGRGWIGPAGFDDQAAYKPYNRNANVQTAATLSIAAGRSEGAPIQYTFSDGSMSRATLAFPPYGSTIDDNNIPGNVFWPVPTYSGVYSAVQDAFANYIQVLFNNGAQKRVRLPYTNSQPIIGGVSGTPTTLAQVIIPANPGGLFKPGMLVHIGGRRARPRQAARGVRELSGDRTIANITGPDSVTGNFTLTLTCSLNVYFDPCRKPGQVSIINYGLHALSSGKMNQRYKARRSNRRSGATSPNATI